MRYEGMIYRPPSEARSYILQLTIGCARNECTFCSMYKEKTFRIRDLQEVMEDLQMAKTAYRHGVDKIFLADGDALIVKTEILLKVMDEIHRLFPECRRITAYGAPKDVLVKTPEELRTLKDAGLEMIYMGAESGCDEVLEHVKKRATRAEIIEAGLKCREAEIKTSITLISGLGGTSFFEKHAVDSATLISEIKPEYASILTLMLEPEAPLFDEWKKGDFTPLEGPDAVLNEMKLFLSHIDSEGTVFRSNHASNYLSLKGNFNEDISRMLKEIDIALENRSFRPEYFRGL